MGFKIEVWTRGLGVYLVVGAVGMLTGSWEGKWTWVELE